MNKLTYKFLLYGGIFIVLASASLAVIFSNAAPPLEISTEIDEISASDHTKGNPDAKVILIEYSDYECPACAAYDPVIDNIVSEFENHIYFAYRHFPLSGHQNSKPALRATEAANLQGKFWEMHEKIFANQSSWSSQSDPEDIFLQYAEELGLNTDEFQRDYNSSSLKSLANEAEIAALELGLNYTPTLILNGQVISNPKNYEEFRTLIRNAIKDAE